LLHHPEGLEEARGTHHRVRCGWKNRATSTLPVVNNTRIASARVPRRMTHEHKERPDPKQRGMIRFGTDNA
jgi:hypothetical protein